jgi:hypothetical protein
LRTPKTPEEMINKAVKKLRLKLSTDPIYNPKLKTHGRARQFGKGIHLSEVGPKSIIDGLDETMDTIVHEELHIRHFIRDSIDTEKRVLRATELYFLIYR